MEFWKESGNKLIQKKISEMLKDIQETPFEGVGKLEP
ncbi:MAG: type II toxin-antitoxin system YoeB family toxin [Kaistella sp.]